MLEDEEKVPYRRLEPAVQKFIKVAIPTDLERLKQHRLNIEKFRRCRSWERLHKEHINAGRTVQQLRANIQEMEKLFSRVKMEDIPTLTKAINPIKKLAIASIADFLELHLKSKEELKKQFNEEASLGLHSSTEALCSSESSEQNLYLQYPEIPQEENAAESWDTLEKDLVDLDKLVNEFSHLVHAVQYKLSVLPVAGALIGGVVGGPIGLLAGFKVAGIAAALGGGVLGFTGGKLIQRKKETIIKTEQSSSTESQDQELKKVN
ncbi:syntaxin-17 isoform X2 [Bombina bombina]|uniref:syntaxin-17 isoform X2 n=1 Tax=Bombina bombina TaxID=8345 RepID=UPI00235A7236|nr:syntaxin-17 isoform X2 [Bombina bombina]